MRKSNNYYKFMEYVTFGKRHDDTICKDNGVLECLSYATVEDIEDWSTSPYLKCTNHKIGLPNDWLTFKNVLVNEDTIIIYYLTDEREVRIATFLLDNYKTQKELKWDILKSCVEFFLNNDNFSTEILETADFEENNEYEEILDATPTQNADHDRTKYLMETHSFPSTPTHEPTSKKVETSSIYGMFGQVPDKRYSYREVDKVCGDCSHFNACMQGNQTVAPTCCMFDSLYKARKNQEWHHVSLATLANIDNDMLDEKRRNYMFLYHLIKDFRKYAFEINRREVYFELTSNVLRNIQQLYFNNIISYAAYHYATKHVQVVGVEKGYFLSEREETFGFKESRRYNVRLR